MSSSDNEEGLERLIIVLLCIFIGGAVISQIPMTEEGNLWEKGKSIVSSVFSDSDEADDAPPAQPADNEGEPPAPAPDDGTAEDPDGESLSDRLGFSMPGDDDDTSGGGQ